MPGTQAPARPKRVGAFFYLLHSHLPKENLLIQRVQQPLQTAPLLGSRPVLSRYIRCYRTPSQPLHQPQRVGTQDLVVIGSVAGVAPIAANLKLAHI